MLRVRKLAQRANESIESFINRAEIRRRENEALLGYRVGSCPAEGSLQKVIFACWSSPGNLRELRLKLQSSWRR